MKRLTETQQDLFNQGVLEAMAQLKNTDDIALALTSHDLLRSFRFHPWRLLRLMQTHPSFSRAVEATITNDKLSLWYECALCAFPDIPIQLSVCYAASHTAAPFKKILFDTSMSSLLQICLVSDFIFIDRQERLDEVMMKRYVIHDYRTDVINKSFLSYTLLQSCMGDTELARQTATCYKMCYPCGIPPAAFCFASQVQLHHLLVELVPLFENDTSTDKKYAVPEWHVQCSRFLSKILKRYTIFGTMWVLTRFMGFTKVSVELDGLRKFLEPGFQSNMVQIKMMGVVRDEPMGKMYDGRILTLAGLAHLLEEYIVKNKIASFKTETQRDAIIGLYDRIVKAALRYDVTGLVRPDAFVSIVEHRGGEDAWLPPWLPPWYPLALKPGEKSVDTLREQDVLRGLSHDPLYRDVLLDRVVVEPRRDDARPINWLGLIKTAIDHIKKSNAQAKPEQRPTPEYEDITSGEIPAFAFACMACDEREPDKLGVEVRAPFRVACIDGCRIMK